MNKSNSSFNFSNPPEDDKSGSPHIESSGGNFAGGGPAPLLEPFVHKICKGIKKRADEVNVKVPREDALAFAQAYALENPKKLKKFSKADVVKAVAIFEGQYQPQELPEVRSVAEEFTQQLLLHFMSAIFSCILAWRPSANCFISDQVIQQFANEYVHANPPKNPRKFKQSEVNRARQVFIEKIEQQRLEQQRLEQQEREQQWQEQQRLEQQLLEQQRQEQQQLDQQRQQQREPVKPKPVKPPQHGSLQMVGASHRKKRVPKSDILKATPGETDYGRVLRCCGDKRFDIEIMGSLKTMRCKLAGSIIKGQGGTSIKVDDIVLIEMKDYESTSLFQTPGGIIIMKYSPDEIKTLHRLGEIFERCSSQCEKSAICFVRADDHEQVVSNETYEWDLPSSESDDD